MSAAAPAVAVVCGSGYQASIAASFLEREGHPQVSNAIGGMTAWKKPDRPLRREEPAG